MAIEFNESKTKENLMKAFAGESQARNRYTFAAEQAHEKGLYVIENIFRFTANQERAHAKAFYDFFKDLSGENIEILGSYPINISVSFEELLRMAEHNENEEHDHVYHEFEKIAKEEGFDDVARMFFMIGKIEKTHGKRFSEFAKWLEKNELFISDISVSWMCLNCGFEIESEKAPKKCPVCGKEKEFFVRMTLAPYTNFE